jgi:hypothetical protein
MLCWLVFKLLLWYASVVSPECFLWASMFCPQVQSYTVQNCTYIWIASHMVFSWRRWQKLLKLFSRSNRQMHGHCSHTATCKNINSHTLGVLQAYSCFVAAKLLVCNTALVYMQYISTYTHACIHSSTNNTDVYVCICWQVVVLVSGENDLGKTMRSCTHTCMRIVYVSLFPFHMYACMRLGFVSPWHFREQMWVVCAQRDVNFRLFLSELFSMGFHCIMRDVRLTWDATVLCGLCET